MKKPKVKAKVVKKKTTVKKKTAAKKTTTWKVSHKPVVKKRAWSPDEGVALCSARAVAESLRMALSVAVSDEDVLSLYWLTAHDPDAGATILDTLKAAREHGIAGHRPAGFALAGMHEANERLILGAQLPQGDHALTADGPVWWSWGQPYDPAEFPGAVIEEAWAVTW